MGACATKPGDLKVKGEAPLVAEDAAAPLAAADEKAKAAEVPVAAAAEVDQADVSRRRSLSDLLKRVSYFVPFSPWPPNSSETDTKLQPSCYFLSNHKMAQKMQKELGCRLIPKM